MKIVVYGLDQRVGALVNDRVSDLNRASARLPAHLLNFIEAGAPALEEAKRVINQHSSTAPARDGIVQALSSVQLHAPWPERRIACVCGNYAAHLLGMWANRLGKTDVTIEQITQEAKKPASGDFGKCRLKSPDRMTRSRFPSA